MADNIIKRIIKLVLDKESAKQTQDDANAIASGIEEGWKRVATKIAEYVSVAFAIDKMLEFGKEAVKEAMKSEAAWADLKGTINATGDSFTDLEGQIRLTVSALQDATTHGTGEYVDSLTRMISLTGDTQASLNNVGLVANVAAQYFKGDLAPATELVSKTMNGSVTALGKLGIHVKDAQTGLEILAQRSFGAASREAESFGGKLKSMDNTWHDVLENLGNAIIGSDGATDAFAVLKAALKTLGEWISNNREEISLWVTNGIKFAIDAADVLIRAVDGMAKVIGGSLTIAFAAAVKAGEGWIRLAAVSRTVDAYFARGDRAKRFQEQADALNALADSLDATAEASLKLGNERVHAGIDVLATPLFSSDQFSNLPTVTPPKTPGETNAPQLGKNAVTDSSENVRKAIEQFNKDAATAVQMADLLGTHFDATGAEIDRITKLLSVFAAEGVDPASVGMGDLGARLTYLTDYFKPVEDATKSLAESLRSDLFMATLDGATGLDKLKIQQGLLQKAMQSLLAAGIKPEDKALQDLAKRYRDVSEAVKEQTVAMQMQAAAADFLADALGTALQGGLHEAATQKAKQNAIEAAEMLVRAGVFALFGDPVHASASLVLAAQFAGIAAAWGALAASSHGGSSGGSTPPMVSGGSVSPGSDLGSSRASSSDASSRAEQPSAEVSVYLVGPGFDMLNPEVQKVVYGARQQAEERYGPNARIRVVPR